MRVLHITDCHVLPESGAKVYGVDTFRALQRVLTAALTLRNPPDLILATGDLSEDGSAGSYRRLRDALVGTGLPVYAIPGNHDSSQQMQRCPSTGCHLKNDDELIAVLDSHPNARIVLAGHSHQELERRGRYAALLTTPATSAQCRHAQRGDPVDHEDFWASHEFDADKHAFRMLTLRSNGRVDTRIRWVSGDDPNDRTAERPFRVRG
jgi:3',5'-cyclic AMP phosphodiesterase CpdA